MIRARVLLISLTFGVSSLAVSDTTYVVRRGDTILKIADRLLGTQGAEKDRRRYAVARQILAKNPSLKEGNVLGPGMTLVIPDIAGAKPQTASPAAAARGETHVPAAPAAGTPAHPHSAPVAPEDHGPIAPADARDFFVVQPRFQFDNYKVTNTTTSEENSLGSRINAGIGFVYGKAMGSSTHLVLKGGANHSRLQQFKSAALTLENPDRWLKSFGVGIDHRISASVKAHLLAQSTEQLFIVPFTAAQFSANVIAMPGAKAGIDVDVLHLHSANLGISLVGEYLSGVTKDGVTYKSSFDPGTMLYVQTHPAEDGHYRMELGYTQRPHATDLTKQKSDSLGVALSLIYNL